MLSLYLKNLIYLPLVAHLNPYFIVHSSVLQVVTKYIFKYRNNMLKAHFSSYSRCPKHLVDLKFILRKKKKAEIKQNTNTELKTKKIINLALATKFQMKYFILYTYLKATICAIIVL